MSASAMPQPGFCEDCDSPHGGYICRACAEDDWAERARAWLLRAKTVAPGLTNAEVAVVERLILDLEST